MCHLTDLELGELDVQRQEDAGAAEDMFVDKETVDKLTEGLLAHYLPDLQKSQGTLHELTWVFVAHSLPAVTHHAILDDCFI